MLKDYDLFDGNHETLVSEVGGYVVAAFQTLNDTNCYPDGGRLLVEPGWTMRDAVENYMRERVDDYCGDMSADAAWLDAVIEESRLTEAELRFKASNIYRDSEPRDPDTITRVEMAATALMRGFEDYWPNPDGDPDTGIERDMEPLVAYSFVKVKLFKQRFKAEAPAGLTVEQVLNYAKFYRTLNACEKGQVDVEYTDFARE